MEDPQRHRDVEAQGAEGDAAQPGRRREPEGDEPRAAQGDLPGIRGHDLESERIPHDLTPERPSLDPELDTHTEDTAGQEDEEQTREVDEEG